MLVLAMEFSRDERRDAPGKRNRADETGSLIGKENGAGRTSDTEIQLASTSTSTGSPCIPCRTTRSREDMVASSVTP